MKVCPPSGIAISSTCESREEQSNPQSIFIYLFSTKAQQMLAQAF